MKALQLVYYYFNMGGDVFVFLIYVCSAVDTVMSHTSNWG